MKKPVSVRRQWIFVCISSALVGAASTATMHAYLDKDRYAFLVPKLPTEVPFSVARSGNKACIDFWILPGLDKLGERKSLSLAFEGDQDGLVDELRQLRLPLKARVFFVRNSESIPMVVQDFEDSMWVFYPRKYEAPTLEKMRDELAFVRVHGLGASIDASIVYFYPEHYGHYVAEVETVVDQPSLTHRTVKLVVGQLNWGK